MRFHDIKNTNKSNKTARKKNVICAIILLGSGSKVRRRVRIVKIKPAKTELMLLKLDMY
jgi:hypothetical protein